jgi:hypothetical protein
MFVLHSYRCNVLLFSTPEKKKKKNVLLQKAGLPDLENFNIG